MDILRVSQSMTSMNGKIILVYVYISQIKNHTKNIINI